MQYRAFFDNAVVGMGRRRLDGRFTAANRALLDMLGVQTIEALRTDDGAVADTQDERRQLVERLQREGQVSGFETEWRTADGGSRFVRLNARLSTDPEDGETAYDLVVEDISDRKEYEGALREARERAEAAVQAKTIFMANMSHEIRTPLTAIIGFASILSRELKSESQRHAQLIAQSGKRLVDTMDAVLTYASLESDGKPAQLVDLDAAEIVRDVVEGFALRAASKGIDLTHDAPSGGRYLVRADAEALSNVLRNLVANALKFTEEGQVEVRLRRDEDVVVIDVTDTGIGISEGFLPHVFEPFRQESTGLSRSHEGNGIGLAIAQRLLQMMGARISVQSEQGRGSTFSVHLQSSAPQPEAVEGTVADAHG